MPRAPAIAARSGERRSALLLVGLTGGIGSGKSTVAWLLAARGAEVIDADECVRRLQEPGSPVWAKIAEHFGDEILLPDGEIDRKKLATIVFADKNQLAALNEITHPPVMREIADALEVLRKTDEIVVLDVPLLVEVGHASMVEFLIVVTASEQTRIRRLLQSRGMEEEAVRARMRNQMPLEEKAAVADCVIHNDGSLDELEAQVDKLWTVLQERRRAVERRAQDSA